MLALASCALPEVAIGDGGIGDSGVGGGHTDGGGGQVSTTLPPGDGSTTVPPTDIPEERAEINDYIRSITNWDSLEGTTGQTGLAEVAATTEAAETGTDGEAYVCAVTRYSLAERPREIVLANPITQTIWPGTLLDGRAHLQGSIAPIAVSAENRAPLSISVAGGGVLGIDGGVRTVVDQPSLGAVRDGINELVRNAINSDVAVGGGYSSFESVESYSAAQTMLEVGLSARYLAHSADAKLNYSTASNEHTYTAYFIQRLYTVDVDAPQSPSHFFSDRIAAGDLAGLNMGPENPPLYVSSVSYGRIVMYTATSSESREAIEGAVNYSYDGALLDVEASVKAAHENTLKNSEIEIMTVGGPDAGLRAMIESGSLASYFKEPLHLNQVEPIAFTVNRLSDNGVAQVVDATEYDQRSCQKVQAPLPEPIHYWPMDNNGSGAQGAPVLVDVIGNGNVQTSGLFAQGGVSAGAGRFDQAVAFDGANFGAADAALVPSDRRFTVAAWIRPTKDDYGTIISQIGETPTAGDFALRTYGGNGSHVRMDFFRRPGNGRQVEIIREAQSVPMNQWSHVVAVYGGSQPLSLYVNGVPVERKAHTDNYSALVGGSRVTRIGSADVAETPIVGTVPHFGFGGGLDEVMVFDRALTDDEIAVMYQNFSSYRDGLVNG